MLRPYQEIALSSMETSWDKGVYDQLLVSATGTGKTVIFSQIPERMKTKLPGQTIVIAHREELINQAIGKIQSANSHLKVSKEKADSWADVDSDVIVASVQTISRERGKRFDFNKITKFIIDEAHHSVSDSYVGFLGSANIYPRLPFDKRLLLGCTATPGRADGVALAKLYKKIVFSYGMRDGIKDGWLVDVKGKRVATKTSLDNVKTSQGDFQQSELADAINTAERNYTILQAYKLYAEGRRTIGFTADIRHAIDLAEMFQSFGIQAQAVWGDDPHRADKLARHQAGDIDVLFNCDVLSEGYDDPAVSCILLCSPTKSGIKYTQRVGRGTRLFLGKIDCLVIDFVDATKRHSLVTLPTLMGLPVNLDLDQKSLLWAVEQVEKVLEAYPFLNLDNLTSIDNLEAFVQDVDLFTVEFQPEVSTHSELTWFPYEGGYILHVPFPKEYEVDWAKPVVKDFITIKQNLLDKWEVRGRLTEWIPGREWVSRTYKAEVDTLEKAFSKGDGLVDNKRSDAIGALIQKAAWHDNPATPAQIKRVRRIHPGKQIPPDLTKGQASRIISSSVL